MAMGRASGHPDYSGNFIPEVWSSKLQVKFYESTILSEIANTDWEGEISDQGDKVHIRTTPDIEIKDYIKGQTLDIQRPNSSSIELLIDKGKYWSAICDDVDKVQSDIDLMNEWSTDASEQMKITVDRDVINTIPSQAAAKNQGATAGAISGGYDLGSTGSPVALSGTNIIDYIVDLGTVLDEQNVPENGRWLTLPSWACGLIKKSELKDASVTGDNESMLRNGRMGMIDRFTLYRSNVLTSTSDSGNDVFNFLAGHTSALTFASQITKVETLRPESTFGTLLRGLNVYGYQVVKPEAMARLYAYKG